MTALLQLGLLVLLLLFSVPVVVFVLQLLLASDRVQLRRPTQVSLPDSNKLWALLIPAHNEMDVVAGTLVPLLAGPVAFPGRVLVVADNCADDTAALCRHLGAEVVERFSATERGKGYALQYGLNHLASDPPSVVVVLDADCTVSGSDLAILADSCFRSAEPTQSAYLMHAREGASVSAKVSEFAWLVKTFVRQLGWTRLTGQCQLLGSGMAFPWGVLSRFNLGSGHIVEDLKLTVDLAKAGIAVRFFPQVRVDSFFPTQTTSRAVQSRRWEHGHLGMIVSEVPTLLMNALRHGNGRAAALALDMVVPPLSLLVILVVVIAAGEWGLAFFGANAIGYAAWATVLLALIFLAVVRAWYHWGREILTIGELLQVPLFLLKKLGIYIRFVVKREKNWTKSDRN